MIRQRVRLRFAKQGVLRFVGHRDLVRAFGRLFRRAGLKLSMSEGYHPKPRMNFPSALALGVAGTGEVMELELAEAKTTDQLLAALDPHCPEGLAIVSVEVLPPGTGKAQVTRTVLQLPVPADRQSGLRRRMDAFMARDSYPVRRAGRPVPVDIRPLVSGLTLAGGCLQMTLNVTRQGSARPREVLAALQVADLEDRGCFLTRTLVELRS